MASGQSRFSARSLPMFFRVLMGGLPWRSRSGSTWRRTTSSWTRAPGGSAAAAAWVAAVAAVADELLLEDELLLDEPLLDGLDPLATAIACDCVVCGEATGAAEPFSLIDSKSMWPASAAEPSS